MATPAAANRGAEKRNYSRDELSQFDGSSPDAPILIAICGLIYDVTPKEDMYGIGGPYSYMAGKDASRMLAKMATKDDAAKMTDPSIADLDEKEQKTLDQWIAMFQKYEVLRKLLD